MLKLHTKGSPPSRAVGRRLGRRSDAVEHHAASSGCPTSASRRCSTRSPRRGSRRRTIRSARSSPTSASSRCPIRGSPSSPRSPSRRRSIPAVVEFVDIAGLVAGASKGEGLGNQFLANIRETDAIAHVVRCFEDDNVVHVAGKVDPAARHRDHQHRARARRSRDGGEAALRVRRSWRKPGGDKEAQRMVAVLEKVRPVLDRGEARAHAWISPRRSSPCSRRCS